MFDRGSHAAGEESAKKALEIFRYDWNSSHDIVILLCEWSKGGGAE